MKMMFLKSEALTIFKQFKNMAELQLGYPLKALQSDWGGGGEFRPFTKYLTELGITHRLICPHTHHQNGVVERKHRHVVDMGLTLLSQSSLPLTYWDHAFLTAVHLINRLRYVVKAEKRCDAVNPKIDAAR
jgi:histone deacetylase 1/2